MRSLSKCAVPPRQPFTLFQCRRTRFGQVLRLSLLLILCLTVSQVRGGVISINLDNMHTAFNRTSTGVYDPVDIYSVPGGFGVAFLLPPVPLNVPRGGLTGGFLDYRGVLETEFPAASGWSFVTAGADLADGALEVTAYDVFGGSFVGIDGHAGAPRTRGFAVRVPEDKDPAGDEHWIQVVRSNHALPDPGNTNHGTEEHKVDTASVQGSPYYDDLGAADSRNFFDIPRRIDEQASHLWLADLQLVTGPAANAPGEVTIYNGIRYGWANLVFTVSTLSELHDSFNDLFNIDSLETEFGADLTGILDTSTLQDLHDDFHVSFATVPEPSTYCLAIFGLLSLAVCGRLRRRSSVNPL